MPIVLNRPFTNFPYTQNSVYRLNFLKIEFVEPINTYHTNIAIAIATIFCVLSQTIYQSSKNVRIILHRTLHRNETNCLWLISVSKSANALFQTKIPNVFPFSI